MPHPVLRLRCEFINPFVWLRGGEVCIDESIETGWRVLVILGHLLPALCESSHTSEIVHLHANRKAAVSGHWEDYVCVLCIADPHNWHTLGHYNECAQAQSHLQTSKRAATVKACVLQVRETQKTIRDSRSGKQEISISRGIGGRVGAHSVFLGGVSDLWTQQKWTGLIFCIWNRNFPILDSHLFHGADNLIIRPSLHLSFAQIVVLLSFNALRSNLPTYGTSVVQFFAIIHRFCQDFCEHFNASFLEHVKMLSATLTVRFDAMHCIL